MARVRYVFEIDDDGKGTLTINDSAPIEVVDYNATFDRPVEAIDPGDMPPADPWLRLRQCQNGEFTLSGKLKFQNLKVA